jgi:ketosteroid isomerase-like protein
VGSNDDIVCVHPQGPRLVGFEAVRESWIQIFASGAA